MTTTKEYAEMGLAAMRRAADEARKIAAMHGLKIPVWKDGQMVYVDPRPKKGAGKNRASRSGSVRDHPFFGMKKDSGISVEQEMENLRGGRYRDL